MKAYDALDMEERGEFKESVGNGKHISFSLKKSLAGPVIYYKNALGPFQHTFKSISNLRNVLDRWISKQ